MQEVMNQAHALSGSRMRLIPFTRRSSVVSMKFKEPSNWPIQNSAIEIIHRTTPKPGHGPPEEPLELSGPYWDQPPSVGPSLMNRKDTKTRKAANESQSNIILNRGN